MSRKSRNLEESGYLEEIEILKNSGMFEEIRVVDNGEFSEW